MSEKTFAELLRKTTDCIREKDLFNKVNFLPFMPEFPYAVGKDFDFRAYMFTQKSKVWKLIRSIVESPIPNIFFVMPWDEFFDCEEEFAKWLTDNPQNLFTKEYSAQTDAFSFIYQKTFWELSSIVLACRGVRRVIDVAKPILEIFVDVNRLGLFALQCLVVNNIAAFEQYIVDCIKLAISREESCWLSFLLYALSYLYDIDRDGIERLFFQDKQTIDDVNLLLVNTKIKINE